MAVLQKYSVLEKFSCTYNCDAIELFFLTNVYVLAFLVPLVRFCA